MYPAALNWLEDLDFLFNILPMVIFRWEHLARCQVWRNNDSESKELWQLQIQNMLYMSVSHQSLILKGWFGVSDQKINYDIWVFCSRAAIWRFGGSSHKKDQRLSFAKVDSGGRQGETRKLTWWLLKPMQNRGAGWDRRIIDHSPIKKVCSKRIHLKGKNLNCYNCRINILIDVDGEKRILQPLSRTALCIELFSTFCGDWRSFTRASGFLCYLRVWGFWE